jgi:hypothetical protein
MAHFDSANGLARQESGFDGAAFTAAIDGLIAAFPVGAPHPEAASDCDLPVLIVGMPRSGTTLVEQILASHPQVGAGGECNFWLRRSGWIGQGRIRSFDPAAAQAMIDDYVALLGAVAPGARRVTDKMPYNFLLLGLVRRLFPRARIVHCRRNPRDTALSIYFSRLGATQPFAARRADIVLYYRQYRRLMAHWRCVLAPERFMEIDYESLVADSQSVSRALIAFCGLEWDPACLDFHRTDRPITTASAWQARQPLYRSSVERWRHYEPWLGELSDLPP